MPVDWSEIGDNATRGGVVAMVLAAAAWTVNLFRRTTTDVETRASRTIADLEAEIDDVRQELRECNRQHAVKDRRMARMERALILADIPIPADEALPPLPPPNQ